MTDVLEFNSEGVDDSEELEEEVLMPSGWQKPSSKEEELVQEEYLSLLRALGEY